MYSVTYLMCSKSSCELRGGSTGGFSTADRGSSLIAHFHKSSKKKQILQVNQPLELGAWGIGKSDGSGLMLPWFIIWLRRGDMAGAAREADRVDEIFPLDMTYTVQKSGAPFVILPGMSIALNLL